MKKSFIILVLILCLSLSIMTAYSESADDVLVIALQPDYFTFDPGYAYELYAPMVIGVTYDTIRYMR